MRRGSNGSAGNRPRLRSSAQTLGAATVFVALSAVPDRALAQSTEPSVQLPTVNVQAKPTTKKAPSKSKKAPTQAKAAPAPKDAKAPATPPAAASSLALQTDATAAEGYRASLLSDVGPLGSMSLLTTPFSIGVLSKDLLENTQATSADDIFKLAPFVHNMWPVARGNPISTVIRGFPASTTLLDNMRLYNTAEVNPEGLERVEVLSGLSGFLYGPSEPGGVINFVQKSPTRFSFADVTGGLIGESGYAHADVGGSIAPGAGTYYRLNVVKQDGGTAVDSQEVHRTYISGAVDFQLSDNALLQVKGFHSDYKATGSDPFWYSSGGRYPSAPDASKLWGQSWGYAEDKQDGGNAKLTWDINDVFTVRGGYNYIVGSSASISVNNAIVSDGSYNQQAIVNAPGTLTTQSGFAALDTKIVTGSVRQTVTVGYSAAQYESELPGDFFAFLSVGSGFNFSEPTYVGRPTYTVGTEADSTYFTRSMRNIFVGDTIDVGAHWSAIVGLNYSTVQSDNYEFIPAAGQPRAKTSSYDDSKLSPTASLIFKPTKWASIYGSYMEGLEEGAIAPSGTLNSGQAFAPIASKQYEVGTKVLIGGTTVTFAAFDITKKDAYAYTGSDNYYTVAGDLHNRGIETTISGKVAGDLTLFGSFTALNAEVENNPTFTGTKPVDVPEEILKLYAEYALPFVPGLTLTGAVNYTSDFAAFADNSQFLPEVVTGDVGFRYEAEINRTPVITRFNITNVTDESYWMSSRFVGAPRAYALTVETKF